MKFGNLHYLWLLWTIPAVIVFYWWATKRKSSLLRRFVSDELRDRLLENFSQSKQRLKILLIVISLLFLVIALIRPKWGYHWEEVKRKGVDIIVALDVSKSMLAQDVSPNRLERAKREIIDLMNILQGDRLGLVAFAGVSFLQSPLTLDYGAVRIFLDDLDTSLIPIGGTAIEDAIAKSLKAFEKTPNKSRVLILITDGEDHQGDPVKASEDAAKKGIRIYTVGIGKKDGAPIPDGESGGFKKDENGNLILTHLDETTLQKIALNTGASYVRSISGDLDLEKIYEDILKKVEQQDLKSGKRKHYEERFQWPLLLAILLLLLEVFVSERRKSLLVMLLVFGISNVYASGASDASSSYQSGDYKEAVKGFLDSQMEDQNNLQLKYNLGNSYYKTGQYEKAYPLFETLSVQGTGEMQQKALYNLGNTAFRMGKLPEAIEHYKRAVELDPQDEDARYNLDYARKELKKRIEENRKRQKKQEKKKQQQKQNKEQNKEQQKQDQKDKEQNQEQKKQDKQDKKQEEKQKKEDKEKNKQDKKEQPKEKKDQQAKPAKEDKKKDKKMDKKQAMRYLRNIDEKRKKHLKKRLKGQGRYRVLKDW